MRFKKLKEKKQILRHLKCYMITTLCSFIILYKKSFNSVRTFCNLLVLFSSYRISAEFSEKQFPELHILFVWASVLGEGAERSFQPNIFFHLFFRWVSVGGDKPVTASQQTHLQLQDDWPAAIAGQHHRETAEAGGPGRDTSETWLTFTGSQTLSCSICDGAGVIVWCLWTRFTLFPRQRSKRMIDGTGRWVMVRSRLEGWRSQSC